MKRTTALTVFSSLIVGIAGERALRRNNIFDERRRDDRPPRPPQNPPTPPENTLPVGDLNIRFNKITDVDGGIPPGPNPMPMQFDDYPLDRNTADWLRQTQAVSVVRYQDCGECDIPIHRLVAEVGGGPSHPSTDVSDPYWEELGEVVRVQQARLRGDDPTMVMHLPDIWAGFNIDEVAEAVHDEVRETFLLMLTAYYPHSDHTVPRRPPHYVTRKSIGQRRQDRPVHHSISKLCGVLAWSRPPVRHEHMGHCHSRTAQLWRQVVCRSGTSRRSCAQDQGGGHPGRVCSRRDSFGSFRNGL